MDTLDSSPALSPAAFDRLRAALEADGPLAAVDRLCDELRAAEDFHSLFYALLMRKRVELGVSPFPNGAAAELPPETHEAYEDAIRQAGRSVGKIYLDRGDIAKAWVLFRMLGEPGPVKDALETWNPGPDADTYSVVEVAWQGGVLPQKGFDIVLDRHGVCSAITMIHSADLSSNPTLREYCVRRLVRALYDQLKERLAADLAGRNLPAEPTVGEIVTKHPELFGEDVYHIDVSHLSSVVQLAMTLDSGPELGLAHDLCLYGEKLAPTFRGDADPPFQDTYSDYKVYLDVLRGVDADAGIAHFRAKADAGVDPDGDPNPPAEVLVNLLLKIGRPADALAVAKQYLSRFGDGQMTCPSVTELARRARDYASLAEAAKSRSDAVTFLAGLIAGKKT